MNKWLLVWNLAITILMLGTILSGCSSIDPQFTYLENQVEDNRAYIEQLASALNENRELVTKQAMSILELKLYTETTLNQLRDTLEEYINK